MSNKVLAVLVTYNPAIEPLTRSIEALQEQNTRALIIDNGSDNVAQIGQLCEHYDAVNLERLGQNKGLGYAHNVGIKIAQESDVDYVLLMDQDSVPMTDMVANLTQAHQAESAKQQVSAVGVTYLNADNGSESFFVRFGWLKFARHYCGARDEHGCINADFLISSGSLIHLDAIENIGLMDESLFIDHVDTEWFLRARSKGFTAYGVCEARMQHGLGENTHRISLAGRQRNVPQHKPFRYYYIFRNSLALYRRNYTSGLWVWNDLQRLAMIMIMFGLVKQPRRANLSMMIKGLRDGLRGISGPLQ